MCNLSFASPPSASLPSAAAFGALECDPSAPLYSASGDIECAFYRLAIDPELGKMFRLPWVRAARVGVSSLHGSRVSASTLLVPTLCVLPMGWSWAPFLCLRYLEAAVCEAGVPRSMFVQDARPGVSVVAGGLAAASYIDNYLVIGHSKDEVDRQCDAVSAVLRKRGVTVHELSRASTDNSFVGLEFYNEGRCLSIRRSRLRRLYGALRALLSRGVVSGEALRIFVGHVTWAMLIRRPSLSLLNVSHAFINAEVSPRHRVLWPSLRVELDQIMSILPLLRVDLGAEYADKLVASDASLFGIGVCASSPGVAEVLYSLRHGGASDDLLSKRRTLAEIKSRGRWTCDNSLKRYAKATRLQMELARLDDDVVRFGREIEARFVEAMSAKANTGRLVVRLPSVLVASRVLAPSLR